LIPVCFQDNFGQACIIISLYILRTPSIVLTFTIAVSKYSYIQNIFCSTVVPIFTDKNEYTEFMNYVREKREQFNANQATKFFHFFVISFIAGKIFDPTIQTFDFIRKILISDEIFIQALLSSAMVAFWIFRSNS
jgi:hypothetical protein